MENPFEILETKINRLESLLQELLNRPLPQTSEPPNHKEIMNVKEAAAYLCLSPQTLYGYTCKRLIPFYKASRRVLFKKSELDEYILSHRYKTQSEIIEEAENRVNSRRKKKAGYW